MARRPKTMKAMLSGQGEAERPASSVQTVRQPESPSPAGLAGLAIDASTTNGMVATMFTSKTMSVELGLTEMVLALHRQVDAVQQGDMKGAESMLLCQSVTLNAIFAEMARRAAMNMNGNIQATETYMRMALKAQSQSRSTLETLSAIKNPPIVFAKQANITSGPQQVNNVMHIDPHAHAIQNQPTQLSGDADELRQDTGTQSLEGGLNSPLEAVGAINRAKSTEGKERSAMRGFKGGERSLLRELARALRRQGKGLAVFDK